MDEQNRLLADVIAREQGRLGSFIRRRVSDLGEAEDILQDVFFELVEAWRLPQPIEQVGAWLFRVARNRIVDRFRKKRELPLPTGASAATGDDEGEGEGPYWLQQALASVEDGPEAAFARAAVLEAISLALEELPAAQRDVFIAHELEGLSFKDLAAQTGVNVNTLLGWKRRAVLHLRSRLQPLYDDFF